MSSSSSILNPSMSDVRPEKADAFRCADILIRVSAVAPSASASVVALRQDRCLDLLPAMDVIRLYYLILHHNPVGIA